MVAILLDVVFRHFNLKRRVSSCCAITVQAETDWSVLQACLRANIMGTLRNLRDRKGNLKRFRHLHDSVKNCCFTIPSATWRALRNILMLRKG
jgi:hypothetical protein